MKWALFSFFICLLSYQIQGRLLWKDASICPIYFFQRRMECWSSSADGCVIFRSASKIAPQTRLTIISKPPHILQPLTILMTLALLDCQLLLQRAASIVLDISYFVQYYSRLKTHQSTRAAEVHPSARHEAEKKGVDPIHLLINDLPHLNFPPLFQHSKAFCTVVLKPNFCLFRQK